MKTKKKFTTSQLTVLGLMSGVLLLMAYTPLGYLNIGPLAISFNVIPVAVSACTWSRRRGSGWSHFRTDQLRTVYRNRRNQRYGAGIVRHQPVLAFLHEVSAKASYRNLYRIYFQSSTEKANIYVSCAVTGFFSAFLNTVFL